MTKTSGTRGLWVALVCIAGFGCVGMEPPEPEQEGSQRIQQNIIVHECGDGFCNGGESCGTCPEDCTCWSYCGDGVCDAGETCSNCAQDCGACPAYCGDGSCNGGETCSSCAQDCGGCPVCGDGICGGGETCSSCEQDCGACPLPDPKPKCNPPQACQPQCGNWVCEPGETCSSCEGDCGRCPGVEYCGDNFCGLFEDCRSCSFDCCPDGGNRGSPCFSDRHCWSGTCNTLLGMCEPLAD